MAQDVTVAGASYSGVPSVELPKTGGGTAVFYDASVATATSSEIANGYTAFGATGLITGTGAVGAQPYVVAALMGTVAGTTYRAIGDVTHCLGPSLVDSNYFTYDNQTGILTCVTAGSYVIHIYVRGTYNSNGNDIACRYIVYHNEINVGSGSYKRSGSSLIAYARQVAVGDTIHMDISIASGSTYICGGYIVEKRG